MSKGFQFGDLPATSLMLFCCTETRQPVPFSTKWWWIIKIFCAWDADLYANTPTEDKRRILFAVLFQLACKWVTLCWYAKLLDSEKGVTYNVLDHAIEDMRERLCMSYLPLWLIIQTKNFLQQQASCKNHRVNRVVFLGNLKRLLTTGVSRWNTRQIALWDQVRQYHHMAYACNARAGGANVCV